MFKQKLITLYSVIAFTCLFCNVFSQNTEVSITGDVGVFIDSNEEVSICGSLLGENNAIITNSGVLNIYAEEDIYIDAYDSKKLFFGDGIYALRGKYEHTLDGHGDSLFFSTLRVLKDVSGSSGDVFLNSHLKVKSKLYLTQGIIRGRVGDGYSVFLSNADPNSLVVPLPGEANSDYAFVDGTFFQKVKPGSTYFFPIGVNDLTTPIEIENNFENVSVLNAGFNLSLPAEMGNTIEKSFLRFIKLYKTGLWNVKTDKAPVGYMTMDAFFYQFNDYYSTEKNMFALVRNSNPERDIYKWRLAGDLPLGGMPARRENSLFSRGINIDTVGYFGVAQAELLKLINIISPGGGRETRIIIPNLNKYDETELIIFNSFGTQVYSKKPYDDSLDMDGYRDGTYYYIFNYIKDGQKGTIQSYIDVKSKR